VRWWLDALERIAQTELALRQPVDARLQVEQCILQIACRDLAAPSPVPPPPASALAAVAKTPPAAAPATKTEPASTPTTQVPIDEAGATGPGTVEEWASSWTQLIEAVNKRKEVSLAGVLRDCRPLDCSDAELTIGALGAFHLDRLNDPDKLLVLTEAVAEVGGVPRKVTAILAGKSEKAREAGTGQTDTDLRDAVLETFAGSRITSSRMKDRDRDNN
jgi:hypothetical protein